MTKENYVISNEALKDLRISREDIESGKITYAEIKEWLSEYMRNHCFGSSNVIMNWETGEVKSTQYVINIKDKWKDGKCHCYVCKKDEENLIVKEL